MYIYLTNNSTIYLECKGIFTNKLKNKNIIRAAETDFRIFPNPSSGDFNISCENIDSEWVEFDLFDYTGKRILNTGFYNAYAFGNSLKKGIYLAVIRSQQHTQSFKIIKQ